MEARVGIENAKQTPSFIGPHARLAQRYPERYPKASVSPWPLNGRAIFLIIMTQDFPPLYQRQNHKRL